MKNLFVLLFLVPSFLFGQDIYTFWNNLSLYNPSLMNLDAKFEGNLQYGRQTGFGDDLTLNSGFYLDKINAGVGLSSYLDFINLNGGTHTIQSNALNANYRFTINDNSQLIFGGALGILNLKSSGLIFEDQIDPLTGNVNEFRSYNESQSFINLGGTYKSEKFLFSYALRNAFSKPNTFFYGLGQNHMFYSTFALGEKSNLRTDLIAMYLTSETVKLFNIGAISNWKKLEIGALAELNNRIANLIIGYKVSDKFKATYQFGTNANRRILNFNRHSINLKITLPKS